VFDGVLRCVVVKKRRLMFKFVLIALFVWVLIGVQLPLSLVTKLGFHNPNKNERKKDRKKERKFLLQKKT